jgi:hypothetical protein
MSSDITEVNGTILSLKILFKAVLEMILQWDNLTYSQGIIYKIRDKKLLEWGHISTAALVRWKIQMEVKSVFLDFSRHEEGMFLLTEIVGAAAGVGSRKYLQCVLQYMIPGFLWQILRCDDNNCKILGATILFSLITVFKMNRVSPSICLILAIWNIPIVQWRTAS